jgi:tripartite-type tricarboxylate transporter receptor subunit TctC
MRTIAFATLLTIAAAVPPAGAHDAFPSRPVDFIVTWGTGGGADAMARTLAALAQPHLGVPIPIANVPGASGNTGLAQILSGKPDGYAIATYIADTLATIPMGLARYTTADLEWVVRTQVANSFFFVRSESPSSTPSSSSSASSAPSRSGKTWPTSGSPCSSGSSAS